MPTSSNPVIVQTPKKGLVQIVNADASGQKTLITAGASGTKVTSLRACSDDTTARVLQLSVLRSAVNYVLGTVTVPIAAGTDGTTPAVDLLGSTLNPGMPVDNDGQKHLFLESGDVLQVKSLTTVTAAKTVHLSSNHGDF